MKRLRVVLVLLALAWLACAGVGVTVVDALRPEAAAPELRQTRAPRRIVRDVAPDGGCALEVRVVDEAGAPLPDARVTVSSGYRGVFGPTWEAAADLDADGSVSLDLPCAFAQVVARLEGRPHAIATMVLYRDAPAEPLRLVLSRGLRVYGTVRAASESPIAGASVLVNGESETTTAADGSYAVWVDPGTPEQPRTPRVAVEAFGYLGADEAVEPADEAVEPADEAVQPADDEASGEGLGEGVRLDFTLERRRQVRVWCAGMPDDECGDLPVQCTAPLSPIGEGCEYQEALGETVCDCPEGAVAVRGGGRAVLIEADAEEAWLDFRDTGRIVGRAVMTAGAAEAGLPCMAFAIRVPAALEDLPRGLVAARRTRCEPDGSFVLEGLVEGDWEVVVQGYGEETSPHRRVLTTRRVRLRETVDVGDVTLPGGGVIEGRLVEGATGEGLPRATIIAYLEGAGSQRVTVAGEDSDAGGAFRLEGLPPGVWTVAYVLSPHERVRVTVREGQVSGGVEVVSGDSTALDENGFALTTEDGALVVQDVAPGSPAADAGLEPGEEVVGVLIGGFDLSDAVGGDGGELARAVLGHWDGPGVTLVVRGPEGGEEEVPLEW